MSNKLEILERPFMLEILSVIDGKNNITEITNQVGLSYKSVLEKLNLLEKAKIVTLKPFPTILENVKEEVMDKVSKYIGEVEFLKEKSKKNLVIILKIIEKNRFLSRKKLKKLASEKGVDAADLGLIYNLLERNNFIELRFEITKQGRQLLKQNEN